MFENWTLCILTIPSRDFYLRQALDSISGERERGLAVKILYNCPISEKTEDLSSRLSGEYGDVETMFYDSEHYGLPEGKNYLLSSVETPLVAFLDDDCTIEGGDVFLKLEETLRKTSFGLIGLQSFRGDSYIKLKPREKIPQQNIDGMLYVNVEGLFGASYTQLLRDLRGFNERKRFRVEWMDLNTKLRRAGYTTGIDPKAGFLRHWIEAPESPIRDRKDTNLHLFYALMAMAVEFDCYGQDNRSRNLWKRIAEDEKIPPEQLLVDISQVIPRLLEDKGEIVEYRDFLRSLPFDFMPLEPINKGDLMKLIEYSESQIGEYKALLK